MEGNLYHVIPKGEEAGRGSIAVRMSVNGGRKEGGR
jgi:hypothetical protein